MFDQIARSLEPLAGAAIALAAAAGWAVLLLFIRHAPEGAWEVLLVCGAATAGILGYLWFRARQQEQRARMKLEAALTERELLLESIEVTPTPFALYDRDDRLIAWNKSYQELHEPAFSRLSRPIRYSDLMREAARQTLPPDAVEKAVADRVAIQACGDGAQHDRLYPNGRWLRVSKQRTRSGAIAGFASDVTELKQREAELAESEARYRALSETSPVGIWHIDETGAPIYANPALRDLLGLDDTAPLDGRMRHLLADLSGMMLASRQSGEEGRRRFETHLLTSQWTERQVLVVTTGWFAGKGEKESCVATIVDITELKTAQARIEHLATHDTLTGLGNRARFSQALKEALAVAARQGTSVSLAAIDLDHFKEVNDHHGHSSGDALLSLAATRMRAALQDEGLVCRLGGDEFAVILENMPAARVRAIAKRLLAELMLPFDIQGRKLTVAASIGIARFPRDGTTADDLQHCADVALYRVKREGRCGIADFAEDAAREAALELEQAAPSFRIASPLG